MLIFFDIETVLDPIAIANYNGDTLEYGEKTVFTGEYLAPLREKFGDRFDFMPEFHKIHTITCGVTLQNGEKHIKTLDGNETEMINAFFLMFISKEPIYLCGFNIKGFDIPFIVKRALYHKITIPNDLKLWGKKPWDMTNIVDLYEVYKHMGYNSGSLDLVCHHLGITSSKDSIDGSMVQSFHDLGKDVEISEYCKRDVKATMEVYDRFVVYNLL